MGTRADFYVRRDREVKLRAEDWLGSIAWDGYPSGLPDELREATTEEAYRAEVAKLATREDWTRPEDGWPWPWNDSRTTDYAYVFTNGVEGSGVQASCFGRAWFPAAGKEPERGDEPQLLDQFPDMAAVKKVTFGPRSGLLVLGGPTDG